MSRRPAAATAAALILAAGACARAATVPAPVPVARPAGTVLGWSAEAPVTATYQLIDSSRVSIQAGPAGTVDVNIALNGTAELKIQPNADSVRVTAQLTAFEGSFKNSMGPALAITKDDVAGTTIMNLDPNGRLSVVQRAEGSARLRQVASIEALYRNFFVRLPARAVLPGATWTDTVSASDAREGITSTIRTVLSSTYAGDTTIDGRTLRVIRSDAANTLEIAGTSQGVQLVQKMEGASVITTLWDAERRLIAERRESGDLRGTMDMPAMGMTGLPLTATSRRLYRLTGVTP